MNLFKKNRNKNQNNENALQKRNDWISPIESFQKRVNDMFDDFFKDWSMNLPSRSEGLSSVAFNPDIDIKEDDNNIYVSAELPGLSEKDINVELNNNVLTISGEKKEEKEEKSKDSKYHSVERSYGYFERSFTLNSIVDENNIKAEFKNGVLKINLPKSEKDKKKSLKIDIK